MTISNPLSAKMLRMALTGIVLLAALWAGRALFDYYQADPWTRDGRLRADVAQIAPDVSGLVVAVYATHDQTLRKGDPLFQIDPARYDLALADAQSRIDAAKADQARAAATIARASATLAEARREAGRNHALGDLVAGETAQQSETRARESEASLAEARAQSAEAGARAEAARSALDLARLNRQRTLVRAPVDGRMSDVSLRVGNYVTAGAPVLALVDTASLRVEGYFEETKLPHIHIGQAATVRLMGEDKVLTGHVVSVAAAIEDHDRTNGNRLLPAINPSFSWVRLAQRVPVRIRLDQPPANIALIAGRTASVTLARENQR